MLRKSRKSSFRRVLSDIYFIHNGIFCPLRLQTHSVILTVTGVFPCLSRPVRVVLYRCRLLFFSRIFIRTVLPTSCVIVSVTSDTVSTVPLFCPLPHAVSKTICIIIIKLNIRLIPCFMTHTLFQNRK